jgi:hypothetical protein
MTGKYHYTRPALAAQIAALVAGQDALSPTALMEPAMIGLNGASLGR